MGKHILGEEQHMNKGVGVRGLGCMRSLIMCSVERWERPLDWGDSGGMWMPVCGIESFKKGEWNEKLWFIEDQSGGVWVEWIGERRDERQWDKLEKSFDNPGLKWLIAGERQCSWKCMQWTEVDDILKKSQDFVPNKIWAHRRRDNSYKNQDNSYKV